MNWEKPMQAIKIALMILTMAYGFWWSQKVLEFTRQILLDVL